MHTDNCFDFANQVVMVGGAAGNLGQAVAQAFHTAGASLVLLDHSSDRLPRLLPELANASKHLIIDSIDARSPDSVGQAVRAALDRHGRIDVLANTIGGYRGGTPVHETPLETLDFLLDLNARTAFVLSRAVVPVMLKQGSGRIIHTAARAALAGRARSAAQSISKSAVVRLVESMTAELRHQGINVNCVLPGTIDTPQNREAMPSADHSRWVPPQAIAEVVLFLASDAARAVNGAAIPVYGRS
jgi:NAD(P)-dependent dehydrogenase (short-subunit alcohol dehydrogenase family)